MRRGYFGSGTVDRSVCLAFRSDYLFGVPDMTCSSLQHGAGELFYAILAIVVSILTLASFLKVQRYAFFGKLPRRLEAITETRGFMAFSMITLAVLCLGLGLLLIPSLKAAVLTPAVEALTDAAGYARLVIK